MGIINKQILEEIIASRAKLDTSRIPGFVRDMFSAVEEATIQNTSVQDGDNAERKVEVVQNFREAWRYAEENPVGSLNLLSLTEIAGRIEPLYRAPGQTYSEIRAGSSARLTGGHTAPVDRSRISAHLERVMETVKDAQMHPVEEAIFDYFHLIRIQPFENGNKRTANIVMNSLLRENGFLPISIAEAKVADFKDYLEGAIEGFRTAEGNSPLVKNYAYNHPDFRQRQFYDFLARIELGNLRCAENKLAGLQGYEISFVSASPSAEYALKRKIATHIAARGLVGQVRLNEPQKKIFVTAEIPYATLARMVAESNGINKYNITATNDEAGKTKH